MTVLLIILALVLLLAGLAGSIHPLLPGMPLMFAGTWLLAYSQDYEVIGTTALTVLGLIMALAWTLDYVAGLLGAKFTGVRWQAVLSGCFLRCRAWCWVRWLARQWGNLRHNAVCGPPARWAWAHSWALWQAWWRSWAVRWWCCLAFSGCMCIIG